eukprot:5218910-Pleurochrysis_carterae.AAC.1
MNLSLYVHRGRYDHVKLEAANASRVQWRHSSRASTRSAEELAVPSLGDWNCGSSEMQTAFDVPRANQLSYTDRLICNLPALE